jgi:hypothetical protein
MQLPVASDRDRIAAARYAARQIWEAIIRRGGRYPRRAAAPVVMAKGWIHRLNNDGGIVSRKSNVL